MSLFEKILLLTATLLLSSNCLARHESVQEAPAQENRSPEALKRKAKGVIKDSTAFITDGLELTRDPTVLTETFSEAMKRIEPGGQKGGQPTLPDISLAAMAQGKDDNYTAMINIDGQTRYVKSGDHFTIIKNNSLLEIFVQDINSKEVRLLVSPMNQLIILH